MHDIGIGDELTGVLGRVVVQKVIQVVVPTSKPREQQEVVHGAQIEIRRTDAVSRNRLFQGQKPSP